MQVPAESIRHLVTALAQQLGPWAPSESMNIPAPELASLVIGQLRRSPAHIFLAFVVLTHLFNLMPIVKWGSTFSGSSPSRRQAHITSWQHSSVRLFRDFVNFYESFVVLGIYENYQMPPDGKRAPD